jgi:hypothetical protein
MAELTDDQQKIYKTLQPLITALVRKVDSIPNMCMTGFIYGGGDDQMDPFIIHIGNIYNTGEELVRIHWTLAVMAAKLQSTGDYSASPILPAPTGQTPEEIADKLALALLATPLESLPSPVLDVLSQYMQSRQPENT